ncbi:MAG: hypothetical protein Q4G19_00080 [Clostridia bacterium]|nr:hypothetical protein [Clostridia bacterium]
MDKKLFREKSVARIASPEQLDKYIKGGRRGYLIALLAIVAVLGGMLVWALVGSIETSIETGCTIRAGKVICCVPEDTAKRLTASAVIRVEGREVPVTGTSPVRPAEESEADKVMRDALDLNENEWCFDAYSETDLPDGNYRCTLVLEYISPIRLIFN